MKKNKEELLTPEVEHAYAEAVKFAEPLLIAPLDIDFGRGDLNSLRDKLNEVIARINER